MIVTLNIIILAAMIATAIQINQLRSMIGVVMLGSIYSLLTALFFFLMDAVDVAFTEAAVGAGISTVLFLSVIGLTNRHEKPPKLSHRWLGAVVVILTAMALIIGISDLPSFGNSANPTNNAISAYYIEGTAQDIHIPNIVTAVLGSYRGYDTFGEVVVVFAAAIGVLALLWNPTPSRESRESRENKNDDPSSIKKPLSVATSQMTSSSKPNDAKDTNQESPHG